jgi:hypothetical protein
MWKSIPRSLVYQKVRGNGDYWRGQTTLPTWLKPSGLVAFGYSTASATLSYPVATANYGPAKMAGTVFGASSAMGLATVAWNERPPR